MLNDWQPYIYRTEDYGQTWTRLTTGHNGVPEDFSARVVWEDPDREGLLSRSFRGSVRVPEYLQPGVMIDYYFSEKPDDVVMLEIRDGNGNLVRSFASKRKNIQPEGLEFDGPILPTSPGKHRFFWDMRHAGAWNRREGRRSIGGPVVAPGIYQAKLIIGDWTHTERFRVLVDPRLLKDGVAQTDLVAQESLSLQVRDMLSKANRVVERIHKARESEEVGRKNKEKLAALYAKLVTATGPYP